MKAHLPDSGGGEVGLHTALDTSGFLGARPTYAFADRLAELGKAVWVRYVLVPGWTDAPAEIEAVAGRYAGLANVERVDVLVFHTLGRSTGVRPRTPAVAAA